MSKGAKSIDDKSRKARKERGRRRQKDDGLCWEKANPKTRIELPRRMNRTPR